MRGYSFMTKTKKIILRLGLLLFFVVLLSIFFIQKARIHPILFSLKEGEISCETTEDCLKKVKDNISKGIAEQLQIQKNEFRRTTFILASFALLPVEYKIDFENRSYLKVWITGTDQKENVTDLPIECNFNGMSKNLKYAERFTIYQNLELDKFQDELFDRFDGCVISSSAGILDLKVKGWIWPPGAFLKVSFERDFQFIPQLRWTSIILIFLQSFIVILLILPVLRQGGLYITKGIKYFFNE